MTSERPGDRWLSPVPKVDNFGQPITDEFIDGKTRIDAAWALMTPVSWKVFGGTRGRLGIGLGQRNRLDKDTGNWIKVEG